MNQELFDRYQYVESIVFLMNNDDQMKLYQALKDKFEPDLLDFDRLIENISVIDKVEKQVSKPLYIEKVLGNGRKYCLAKILKDGDIVYDKTIPNNKHVYSQVQNCMICQISGRKSYSFSGIVKNKTGIRKNIIILRDERKYHLQIINLQGKLHSK